MKILYSIVIFVALIVIITFGLKRNNGFFNHGYHLGELNYLTPAPAAPAEAKATAVADTTKKAEEPKGEEAKKEEAGEKPAEGEHK